MPCLRKSCLVALVWCTAAPLRAQATAGANYAVARRARIAAFAHDGADGAPRARRSRKGRDVAIGRDTAGRDAPDGVDHTLAEGFH